MEPAKPEPGPDARRMIGGWRLISSTVAGQITAERGGRPTGLVFYDASGWVSVQFQQDGRDAPMAGNAPTAQEALAAVQSYWAYFGAYTVDERAKLVTHHRQGSVTPGWESQRDYVRAYAFQAPDRLILRPVDNTNELIWERLR